ncbi:short-chain dehydrogenase [Bacillus cereus]|uniref:SDR family oxidoreductase n=1 Tax=Bacillus cereus group TaxID=86661 RepID=UPI000BED4761|nr:MULTISPECIES: SDR family oxidoreductase [Bacillus cereus group]PDZ05139.1 short-chain dehydrogenase [Bacillus cereus]PEC52612.1 short-chain dehydrogenase [Bacillus cereus]PFE41730.1 short-chain dehydrogenase [Bacillus cereus]PFN13522.1 short-chain dehydrogenase [Bacillus cereus]PFO69368.1 short-chain dehydrogenase [Bacillus cereus]
MGEISNHTKWSLRDKYIVITGATSGIGLAAAKVFAERGAKLGIIARNEAKANDVMTQLEHLTNGNTVVDIFFADMASQQSIRRVATDILERCPRIDILVNNAGALFQTRQITEDGLEMTWAVNHLGPFLLTDLLLERLKESAPARVITTASHGHKMAKKGIDFGDLDAEQLYRGVKKFMGGPTMRYAQTKLANILFTSELAQRLEGTGVSAYSFDPGLVNTNFNQDNGLVARLTMAAMKPFSRTPEEGAETLIWLAESNGIIDHSGCYYADKQIGKTSEAALDKGVAKRLWDISEKQTRE